MLKPKIILILSVVVFSSSCVSSKRLRNLEKEVQILNEKLYNKVLPDIQLMFSGDGNDSWIEFHHAKRRKCRCTELFQINR